MGKVSITNTYDFNRFVVTFADKTKLSGKYGAGTNVKIEPHGDTNQLRRVCEVLDPAFAGCLGLERKYTVEAYLQVVKTAGEAANGIESFIDDFRKRAAESLSVNFESSSRTERTKTTAVVTKESRARWRLLVLFANGDDFMMTFTGGSVGTRMTPSLSGLENMASNLAFTYMSVRKIKDGELMARTFAASAEGCRSSEEWIDALQAEIEGRQKPVVVAKSDPTLIAKASSILQRATAAPGDKIVKFHPDALRAVADAFAALLAERDALLGTVASEVSA
jgi:hypothetical protein